MVQLNSVPVFGAKKIPVPFDGNFPPKFSCKWEVLQIISARLPRTLCGLPVRMLCHITYHTFHTDSSQMDPSEQPVAPSYADVQASCSCIRTPVVLSSATLTWLHCIALQCVASRCSAMYYTWLHCTALHNVRWRKSKLHGEEKFDVTKIQISEIMRLAACSERTSQTKKAPLPKIRLLAIGGKK